MGKFSDSIINFYFYFLILLTPRVHFSGVSFFRNFAEILKSTNMKKVLLTLAVVLTALLSTAQNPLTFDYVIQKDSVSAEQIYNAIIDWIATDFKAVDGDFYHDKESFTITKDASENYNATRLVTSCYEGKLRFKLKFKCKDGRFKFTITNFNHSNIPGHNKDCVLGLITEEEPDGNRYDREIWNDIKSKAESIALEYRAILEKITINTAEDDW